MKDYDYGDYGSNQRNFEETTRNPWDMETNLQNVDKRLTYDVISKDDSLLQNFNMYTPTHTHTHTHTHCITNTQTDHYGFCIDRKENICVLKVLPVIFSYFFPPAVIIFSHVKQIKMPKPHGGSGSDFPLSGSQTRLSYKQALCKETWPVCGWMSLCRFPCEFTQFKLYLLII